MTKILTSHVGSLPRTQEVVDFIFARENGEDYDKAGFDGCMTAACGETVRRPRRPRHATPRVVAMRVTRPLRTRAACPCVAGAVLRRRR
ncbi:MAG: hypothetical protein VXW25_07720, partial [Pseudomonadota bacterium]|nr:hypothetical protein [Pseudomonadota bacterium]